MSNTQQRPSLPAALIQFSALSPGNSAA